ncbi:Growth-regulating factor 2 [Hirschfeldia incana]|nr:Growth-regulating factor 2 [Hirschfeldia incana]
MDIGTHILGSVTGDNVNGSSLGLKELVGSKRDRSGFDGEDCLQQSSKLARTTQDKYLPPSYAAAYSRPMSFHQGIIHPLTRSGSLLSSDSRRQEHMLSFSDKPEAFDFSKYVGLDNNKNSPSPSPFLHQLPPPCYRSSGGGYGSGGMMSMQGKGPFTLTQWAELEQQALIYKYITANVPVPSSLLISIQKSFYPYRSLPPSSFGWGTFHLGFAGGNMDPEPGRCRRTDGKKWRCSKDAVPDQKYCDKHINRGRHRSRKPVEVQPGHTPAAAAPPSKAVASRNRSLPTASQIPNNRVHNAIYPSTVNLQPKEERNNNNNIPFGFGHVTSPSLLTSSYLNFSGNQDNKPSLNHRHNSWPEELKSDWTQLSMSIPVASSSSPSSTAQDKTTFSPLRLSCEFDLPIQSQQERLESVRKVNTWIPISWGNSLGGPLGEVLNNSTTSSPTLGSSPTGVLQKSTYCSLSNSSSVSSPVADNNRNNNVDYFHYTT